VLYCLINIKLLNIIRSRLLGGVLLKAFVLFINFWAISNINAQTSEIDSLKRILSLAKLDTSKVNAMNELGWQLKKEDQKIARKYLEKSISLAHKIDYPKGEAEAYNYLAVIESMNANFDLAVNNYQKALELRKRIKDLKGIGSIYNNLGLLYDDKGDFYKAIDYHKLSYDIQTQRKDTLRMGRAAYNVSRLFWRMGNYPKALENAYVYLNVVDRAKDKEGIARAYNHIGNINTDIGKPDAGMEAYNKALEYWKIADNQTEIANTLNNIGSLKDDFGEAAVKDKKYDDALKYYNESIKDLEQSLAIRIKDENEIGQSEIYNNLGVVNKNLGSFYEKTNDTKSSERSLNTALDFFKKALDIRTKLEDKKGIIEVYNGFGDVYRRQKHYDKALYYTNEYKKLAEDIGDSKFEQSAYKDLAAIYALQGNYDKAYENRLKYEELKDKRLNESNMLKYQQDEFDFKESSKQREIETKQNEIALNQEKLKTARTTRNSLLGGSLLLFILAMLLYNRNVIKTKANNELTEKNEIIDQERKRSDELLLNILPESTALELKQTGSAKAKSYKSVTVLFTDFKNFTQIAEKLSAEELVAELDTCFKAFDDITTKYHIEKIKTIGDAYMCAGGIPVENTTHPFDAVHAGIEMIQFLEHHQKDRQEKGLPIFQVRIGIHTGSVVAGVVGTRKFAYDIWGDAVNLASRMESSGEPGKVNISEATYQIVKDQFVCTHRGKIEAKNKGMIDMYFAEPKV